ncbi:MAG: fibrobacter succinogenes major paralogous domain-containing protein, partial [Flavobacteriales bacterium]
AVDDGRGLCPSGWHVPSDGEWTVLTDHLGGESVAGGQMKSTYGWGDDGNGTNSSGFTGLPGGYRGNSFASAGGWGAWWSSTPTPPDGWLQGSGGWSRLMTNSWDFVDNQILAGEGQGVGRFETAPGSGQSVRCVRDAE